MGAGASTDAPSFDGIDISKWSKEQVADEVAGLGTAFEEYTQMVIANDIDGKTLAILTSEDLEDAGMAKGLHRKKILAKVEELSGTQATIKSTAAATSTAARSAAQQGGSSSNNKLFMSYARGDESTPFARRLKAFLEGCGFDVWMDEEGIAGGVDFLSAIGEQAHCPPFPCNRARSPSPAALCRCRDHGR
jgi:hypothetical protein